MLKRRMNQMQRPVNTLNRDHDSASGRFHASAGAYHEPPTKRQRTNELQRTPTIRSKYFLTKSTPSTDDIVVVKDSQDGTSDRRSVSSAAKAVGSSASVSEYRQIRSSQKIKKKRSRNRGPRQNRQSHDPPSSLSLSHTGEGAAGEATIQMFSSPPESPDALAVDDEASPTRVVSDIITSPRPGKRPRKAPSTQLWDGPSLKRHKPDPIEPIEVSEDELQAGKDSRGRSTNFSSLPDQLSDRQSRHQRGDIQQTEFKTADERRVIGEKESQLRVRRAVSGSLYFEDDESDGGLFLNMSSQPLISLERAQAESEKEPLLRFDVSKIKIVRHHISTCAHVTIIGPASLDASGKTSLEFFDTPSTERFVRALMPSQCEEINP
jgi:hypothetical protein